MKHQISGSRDGQRWPAPGGEIDVPDHEAGYLESQGMAERVPEPEPEPESEPEPAPPKGKGPSRNRASGRRGEAE